MKIGIVGLGVVGGAILAYHQARGDDVWVHDIDHAKCQSVEGDEPTDAVFICVPTPYLEGGGLDCSRVDLAIATLTGSQTVIIKSTVMPGTTDKMQAKYPQHLVFFVPEFLSEATAVEDYATPRRQHVLGVPDDEIGIESGIALTTKFRALLPEGQAINYMMARQAELLKLATNAFYALKVVFANECYDAGMKQETLDALGDDPWVGGEHFTIMAGAYRGYGGSCLPKDTLAFHEVLLMACKHERDDSIAGDVHDLNSAQLQAQGIDINKWL